MPTYEYACDACGHEFELVQRIIEPAVKKCPKCKKLKAKRLIVGGSFILKGSGWYADGYSSKSDPSSSSASSSNTKKDKKESSEGSSASASTASDKTSSEKSSEKSSGEKKPAKSKSS